MKKRNCTLLIDGTCLYKIVFEGVQSYILQKQNLHAVWGFLKNLRGKLAAIQNEQYGYPFFIKNVIVFWDGPRSGDMRRDIFPEYKEKRNRYFEGNDPYYNQKFYLMELLGYLGIHSYSDDVVETDDCIAYYVNRYKSEQNFVILTSDRDYFQLIDENVFILDLERQKNKELITRLQNQTILSEELQYEVNRMKYVNLNPLYTPHTFQMYFEYTHKNMLLRKVVLGDESDNIKGAVGCSVKTLEKEIPGFMRNEYGRMDLLREAEAALDGKKRISARLQSLIDFLKNDEAFELNERLMNLTAVDKLFITDAVKHQLDALYLKQQNRLPFYQDPNLKGKFHAAVNNTQIMREISFDYHDYQSFIQPFLTLNYYGRNNDHAATGSNS